MWQAAISKPNSSVTISGVLSAVLVMSLVCSMSMRHGHADAPIALSLIHI